MGWGGVGRGWGGGEQKERNGPLYSCILSDLTLDRKRG